MSLLDSSPDAPGPAAGGVLVIGYGNTLRSDDGVGWHAAALLAGDRRLAGVEVLAVHQLTPELALDMSRASLVILIDASADDPPGRISVLPLDAVVAKGDVPGAGARRIAGGSGSAPRDVTGAGARRSGGGSGASSHHVGPGELVALARELYGAAPETLVVRIGAADMEVGETLSPTVAATLPAVAEMVAGLIGQRGLLPGS